jgi:hypothetical protein
LRGRFNESHAGPDRLFCATNVVVQNNRFKAGVGRDARGQAPPGRRAADARAAQKSQNHIEKASFPRERGLFRLGARDLL